MVFVTNMMGPCIWDNAGHIIIEEDICANTHLNILENVNDNALTVRSCHLLLLHRIVFLFCPALFVRHN